MRLGPLEGVVCYLLPALTPDDAVVRTARKLLVVGNRLGVPVVLDVGVVDRRRHDVVLAARYEQQRCPLFVPEVYVVLLVAWGEVGGSADPHQPARGGDVVALVDLLGLFAAEGVGEGEVELLGGEAHGLVAVGGVPQEREERPDLRDGGDPDALRGHGVYGHACGAVTVVDRIWVSTPPPEWPMMIGGRSSSSMMAPMCSMMAGKVSASIGEGSSRSASTSPSKP